MGEGGDFLRRKDVGQLVKGHCVRKGVLLFITHKGRQGRFCYFRLGVGGENRDWI